MGCEFTIRRSAMSRTSGFTIVELMVVIGIIAVILSMFMPALAKSRRAAETVVCMSNLRQIGAALNLYADQNNDYFPSWSGWESFPNHVSPEDDSNRLGWTEQIMPIFVAPTSRVYQCPSFPQEARINYFMHARWLYVHSQKLTNLKRSDITLSSQFVLGGECTQREMYAPPFGINLRHLTTSDCDKTDEAMEAIVFKNEPDGMNIHPAGNNVLFADRHIETMRSFDPQRMTFNPHKLQDWENTSPD